MSYRLSLFMVVGLACGCNGGASGSLGDGGVDAGGLAILGGGAHTSASVDIVEVVGADAALLSPSDLAFHPTEDHQLWITNRRGDSITIVSRVGAADQSAVTRTSPGAEHFLAEPSSLAFGTAGTFATAQDMDQVTQSTTPADFMGPTLWPADAVLFDGGHDSHLDMLHDSPSGAGIAWDHDNAFWVYDGYHHSIAMYDFHMDHGPGGMDHSGGTIEQWGVTDLGYAPHIGSHIELDRATGLLYIADTRNGRIDVLDTRSGAHGVTVGPNYDGADMYSMDGATFTTLIDGLAIGLEQPSGLALRGGVLYITDHAHDTIHAFSLDGTHLDWLDLSDQMSPASIGAIELDAEGRIYVIDIVGGRVLRLAPRG
jgi:sugar lactone lactonase YvrE